MPDEAQKASRIGRHAWMDGQHAERGGGREAFANAHPMIAIPPCGTEPYLSANTIASERSRQTGEWRQIIRRQRIENDSRHAVFCLFHVVQQRRQRRHVGGTANRRIAAGRACDAAQTVACLAQCPDMELKNPMAPRVFVRQSPKYFRLKMMHVCWRQIAAAP